MDIRSRVDSAESYFRFLNTVRYRLWSDIYIEYVGGSLTLPESAVLVHPMWRDQLISETPCRRQRSFQNPPPAYESCAASTIWGYACPSATSLQTDHRFPWALGGPTSPGNAVYLCRDHNQMKGHDVHLIAWTVDNFAWLHDEVEEVRRLLRL
ncbi:hypothetical protein GCM10025782_08780 [Pedococcus ginsenosidimutans]|uniref:HNH nuclease domain-containing protein n=1 Tax=Pedococcus ginsenosidimutans TaxID=490570 RepID=A0ABP8XSJ9_9MICO